MGTRKVISICVITLIVAGIVSVLALMNIPHVQSATLQLANSLGLSDKYSCIRLPKEVTPFDSLDSEELRTLNPNLRFIVNANHLSVVHDQLKNINVLRQRFVPSDKGSERVVAALEIKPRITYELKQKVLFENDFNWGVDAQSGKFGFGFGGGTAPSGGKVSDDGFTARLAWRGHGDGTATVAVYLYSADRTQNLPYGDEFEVSDFTIPVSEWIDISLRVTANSDIEANDGSISVRINDEIKLERNGIQWQSAGEEPPQIDRLLFSTFHGGNSSAWSPPEVVYARFSNACLFD